MVGTTGTSMLGLTIGCARCHDHKFDPIPQRDFYALQAVFAGVLQQERPLRFADGKDLGSRRTANTIGGKRPPVNASLNEERFAAIPARAVRFTILASNDGTEPCIDELEVYEAGGKGPASNIARASAGTKTSSSGNYLGSPFHKLEHINDGQYGNGRSWISKERGRGWVRIDLPKMAAIDRIVWGRDRELQFSDRLATAYKIEILGESDRWVQVASSDDREPYAAAGAAAQCLWRALCTAGADLSAESRRPDAAVRAGRR